VTGHSFTWARDLPPFDENASCPQCGEGTVKVIFHPVHTRGFPCETARLRVLDGHLCRVCGRCGYGWCEAGLATKPARPPELKVIAGEKDSEP
jgi:ribosomal protein S27AE